VLSQCYHAALTLQRLAMKGLRDMSKDLTIGDVQRSLKRAGCTLQLSFSSGQYHAYVHRGNDLVGYDRGDEFAEAVERACGTALPKEPIGSVRHQPLPFPVCSANQLPGGDTCENGSSK
jgi:hypothetical protein